VVEVGNKKDRVEDALKAKRAAVKEYIVPGGGMTCCTTRSHLDDYESQNQSIK